MRSAAIAGTLTGPEEASIRYVLRRAGFYLFAAWVALSLNFLVPRLMPGDPATALFARFQGELDPEAIDALRGAFGLTDAPLWQQYLTYLSHVVRGDLGISIAYSAEPRAMSGGGWTRSSPSSSTCSSCCRAFR